MLFEKFLGRAEADLSKIMSKFTSLRADLLAHIEHHNAVIATEQRIVADVKQWAETEQKRILGVRDSAVAISEKLMGESEDTIVKAKHILANVEDFLGKTL